MPEKNLGSQTGLYQARGEDGGAAGPRTIGQKISQELQIYQQTLLQPKGSKSPRNLQQIMNKKLTMTRPTRTILAPQHYQTIPAKEKGVPTR